jgi:hypothetical protein
MFRRWKARLRWSCRQVWSPIDLVGRIFHSRVTSMSYSFFVPAAKAPKIDELLRRIDLPDLMVVDNKLISKWPGVSLMVCHRERSTRGVYLSYANCAIEVKTNVLSSPEDYHLALRVTIAAAEQTGSRPRGEFSDPVASEELLARHGEGWITDSHMSGLRATRALVKSRGPMGLSGPFRLCYIGPRILEEVGHADDVAAVEGMLNLMRQVQWIHTAGYEAASELTIGGTKQHLAI